VLITSVLQPLSIPSISTIRSRRLFWWEWCKLGGLAALVALALVAVFGVPHPLFTAVLLHLFVDFTAQGNDTAAHKGERGRHLALHAVVSGLPMAVAGATVSPQAILVWTAAGIVAHYAVDWTRKFGIESRVLGGIVDQVTHAATMAAIILTVG
jgi:hypothetical protein